MTDDLKAIDKNDGTGIALSLKNAAADGRPYLGNLDVVSDLLRDFLARQMGIVSMRDAGDIDTDTAVARGIGDCEKYADIFLGDDAAYNAVDGWNGPELATYLLETRPMVVPPDGTDEEQVAAVLMDLAQTVFAISDDLRGGDLSNEQKSAIDSAIQSTAWILSGIDAYD